MKQPWVYMCSPSRSPHPPPSPPAPSRSSQCTRSKCLSHASNNSGKNLYYFFLDAFPHVSEYIYHELIKFTKGDKEHDSWFNLSKTLIILLQVDRSLAKMSCQQNQQQCQPPPKLPPKCCASKCSPNWPLKSPSVSYCIVNSRGCCISGCGGCCLSHHRHCRSHHCRPQSSDSCGQSLQGSRCCRGSGVVADPDLWYHREIHRRTSRVKLFPLPPLFVGFWRPVTCPVCSLPTSLLTTRKLCCLLTRCPQHCPSHSLEIPYSSESLQHTDIGCLGKNGVW